MPEIKRKHTGSVTIIIFPLYYRKIYQIYKYTGLLLPAIKHIYNLKYHPVIKQHVVNFTLSVCFYSRQ